mmetsp:Transcript_17562/g.50133  ORF Transcript_17562/g.50133 Transcript_17562/m.50133 type:complete len:258 (-) Transcript_17562:80-853(-)
MDQEHISLSSFPTTALGQVCAQGGRGPGCGQEGRRRLPLRVHRDLYPRPAHVRREGRPGERAGEPRQRVRRGLVEESRRGARALRQRRGPREDRGVCRMGLCAGRLDAAEDGCHGGRDRGEDCGHGCEDEHGGAQDRLRAHGRSDEGPDGGHQPAGRHRRQGRRGGGQGEPRLQQRLRQGLHAIALVAVRLETAHARAMGRSSPDVPWATLLPLRHRRAPFLGLGIRVRGATTKRVQVRTATCPLTLDLRRLSAKRK